MYRCINSNIKYIMELLDKEKIDELVNNKNELNNKVLEFLENENYKGYVLDEENSELIDIIRIQNKENIKNIYDSLIDLNKLEIYDVVIKESENLKNLLYKLISTNINDLLDELLTININIFEKKVLYINNNTITEILNIFNNGIEDCNKMLEALDLSKIEISNRKLKSFRKSKKGEYERLLDELDKIINTTSEFKSKLNLISMNIKDNSDRLYAISNSLALNFKYSKEFI